MYTHILLPTDGSELSKMALREGIDLAKALGAKVTVMTVTPPFHVASFSPFMLVDTAEAHQKHMAVVASQNLQAGKRIAAVADVACDVVHVEHEHPYRAIIDTAQDRGCDAILMASHGRSGMSAVVLGSETMKVLTHSTIPVIVYRAPRASIAQILAAS
jgi:nucleotide-binding universal stress UspA family protein